MNTTYAILGAVLGFGFSAYLGHIAFTALRSGVARIAGGKEYKRKKSPLMYWIAVGVQSSFSALMLCVGITRLVKI